MRFKYTLHTPRPARFDVEAQDLETVVSKGQCTRWCPHLRHGWQMTRCTSWCGEYESALGPFARNRSVVA